MTAVPVEHIVETATPTRLDVTGHNARYLRLLGTVGAVAAMVTLGLMFVP